MPIGDKTRKALEELGLTNYELRVYLALLEYGMMAASQVSRSADIPYSKIYEVLGNLEKKGWIEIQRGRPSRYYSKPPSEAVETMKLRLEETLRASERVILADLQPLYERREVRERPDIWIVRGQYNILAKIKEIFTRTVREIQLAIPLLPKQAADLLAPALMGLRVRGVKVVILITEDTPKGLLQQLMGLGELRVKDKMFGGGVISDGREVMLLLSGEGEEESTLAIWSDHISLAKFAKSYFAFLWDTARPPPP